MSFILSGGYISDPLGISSKLLFKFLLAVAIGVSGLPTSLVQSLRYMKRGVGGGRET